MDSYVHAGTDVMILIITIWRKKLWRKTFGIFLRKLQLVFFQKFDRSICFWEKRQFFSPKIGKKRRKL
jgi:hypothetical protein